MGEYFSENNYQTYMINGSWRLVPTYGFCKGFDKTLYKKGMSANEAIEHFFNIDTNIQNEKKFYWITFFDLHSAGFNNQIGDNFFMDKLKENNLKSVYLDSNLYLTERYAQNCKLLDLKLSNLYNYINKTYKNEEILISLVSDHGQSFFDNEKHILKNNRVKVPWMLRGRNVSAGKVNHFSENVDILPNLLSLNNFKFNRNDFDGQICEIFDGSIKENVKSQSIFPNNTYKMRIDFKENEYFIESEDKVNDQCELKNTNQKIKIFNSTTNKEISISDANSLELKKVKDLYLNSCKNLSTN